MRTAALGALLLTLLQAAAQEIARTPLPPSHPLVGSWRNAQGGPNCAEEVIVRADGSLWSASGQERNEADAQIALAPSPSGFYVWTDKITRGNRRPDCAGATAAVGDINQRYVRLHPSGERFLLCQLQTLESCYAEFTRLPAR